MTSRPELIMCAPLMPKGDSAAPKLRAMATNYPVGHLWDKLDAQACIRGALEIEALRTAAPSPAAHGDALDAERLDWLALAGPVHICLVIDRERDGEIELSTDDVTGYGKTLREAIDAARAAQEGRSHTTQPLAPS